MGFDFYDILRSNNVTKNMPAFTISSRNSDKRVVYDQKTKRLDNISGEIYGDETMWRVILWANPQYFVEFDIPNGTVIRVPWPLNDVIKELSAKITSKKNK